MATYHWHVKVFSRSNGHSAVAAAAYRHRSNMVLENEQELRKFNYSSKSDDLAHEEIALPKQTPQWLKTLIDGRTPASASEAIWNKVEETETRVNSQLAREAEMSLPLELTREQSIELAREYVKEAFTSKGMIADWVFSQQAR